MTKSELRKARKQAKASGLSLVGELAISDKGREPVEFTETAAGYRARDRWAERYYERNGAPESDYDR